MIPLLDPSNPAHAHAEGSQEIAGPSANAAILMHTDVKSSTAGWLHDAWRLWARTTEHPDTPR